MWPPLCHEKPLTDCPNIKVLAIARSLTHGGFGIKVTDRNTGFLRWDLPLTGPLYLPSRGQPTSSTAGRLRQKRRRLDSAGDEQAEVEAATASSQQDGMGSPTSPLVPVASATVAEPIDLTGGSCFRAEPPPPPTHQDEDAPPPFFRIVGSVDGISEQLDASADDPDDWTVVRRVIEVKHRMNPAALTRAAPLYDQLQLAVSTLTWSLRFVHMYIFLWFVLSIEAGSRN